MAFSVLLKLFYLGAHIGGLSLNPKLAQYFLFKQYFFFIYDLRTSYLLLRKTMHFLVQLYKNLGSLLILIDPSSPIFICKRYCLSKLSFLYDYSFIVHRNGILTNWFTHFIVIRKKIIRSFGTDFNEWIEKSDYIKFKRNRYSLQKVRRRGLKKMNLIRKLSKVKMRLIIKEMFLFLRRKHNRKLQRKIRNFIIRKFGKLLSFLRKKRKYVRRIRKIRELLKKREGEVKKNKDNDDRFECLRPVLFFLKKKRRNNYFFFFFFRFLFYLMDQFNIFIGSEFSFAYNTSTDIEFDFDFTITKNKFKLFSALFSRYSRFWYFFSILINISFFYKIPSCFFLFDSTFSDNVLISLSNMSRPIISFIESSNQSFSVCSHLIPFTTQNFCNFFFFLFMVLYSLSFGRFLFFNSFKF